MCSVWSRGQPNPRREGGGSRYPLLGFTTPPPTRPFLGPTSDAEGSSSLLLGTPCSIATLTLGSYATSSTIFSTLLSSLVAGAPCQPSPSTTPTRR